MARRYFRFMDAFFSCSTAAFEVLQQDVERTNCVPDVTDRRGIRQLKRRPSGVTIERIEPEHRRLAS